MQTVQPVRRWLGNHQSMDCIKLARTLSWSAASTTWYTTHWPGGNSRHRHQATSSAGSTVHWLASCATVTNTPGIIIITQRWENCLKITGQVSITLYKTKFCSFSRDTIITWCRPLWIAILSAIWLYRPTAVKSLSLVNWFYLLFN